MSLLQAVLQVRQFSVARYLPHLEKSPATAPEEVANIHMLAGDLERKAVRDLADLAGGPDLGSLVSICGDYGRFCDACSVVK